MPGVRSVRAVAESLRGTLTDIRRDLHSHPEPAFGEVRTAAMVAERLKGLDLEVRTEVAKTGVVGLLRGKRRGRTIALRGDMDALPLDEANEVPYRSTQRGIMHACGHDGHVAILLGAAMVLSRLRPRLRGNVKFLFQPAEETIAGARGMIRDGAMRQPQVDAVLGMHVWPDMPMGVIGLKPGPVMAAADHFSIKVRGEGGHGAKPHLTRDPLVPAHHIYQALQTIRRNIDPLSPYVLSVCSFHGGATYNVVPSDAQIQGTLRTLDDAVRAGVKKRIRQIVKGVGSTFGVTCRATFDIGCPLVANDAALVKIVTAAAKRVGAPTSDVPTSMGSEDFAFFLEHAPGAYLRLGTQRGGTTRTLHNNTFNFDEAVLPKGAAVMAQSALGYLNAS